MMLKSLLLPALLILYISSFGASPIISSFSPTSGPIGTKVTITGKNFNTSTTGNIVYFGTTAGRVISASGTKLVVEVMPGASYQPISLLNKQTGLTGYSSIPFITTFPSKKEIVTADFKWRQKFLPNEKLISYGQNTLAGDLDGDGKNDVITHTYDFIKPFLNVLNNGSTMSVASFKPQASIPSPQQCKKMLLVDLTGDGLKDLVEIGFDSRIYIYRNRSVPGNIVFDGPVKLKLDGDDYTLQAFNVEAGDIDGDGKPDLIFRHYKAWLYLSVMRNVSVNNSIAFEQPVSTQFYEINDVIVADMDNDGLADVVVAGNGIQVLKNVSIPGTIRFEEKPANLPAARYINANVADLDNDGKLDIIVAYVYDGTDHPVEVFRNLSINGKILFDHVTFPSEARSDFRPRIADINGDGLVDVLIGDKILRNTTTGSNISFASAFTIAESYRYNILSDVNNDGFPDVIVSDGSEYFSVILNIPTPLPLTNAPKITTLSSNAGAVNSSVSINGENFDPNLQNNVVYFGAVKASIKSASATKMEVTVPTGATYQPVSVLNKKTSLTGFSPLPYNVTFPYKTHIYSTDFEKTAFPTASKPTETAVTDIDMDGRPDLLVSGYDQNYFSIFINTAVKGVINNQSFAKAITINTPGPARNITAGDINNDGRPDIIVNSEGSFYIYRNTTIDNEVSFAPAITIALNGNPAKAYIEDMDNDGRAEIIMGHNSIMIYHNTSVNGNIDNTSFVVDKVIYGTTHPELWIADIDGDGKKDFLTAYNNKIDILINKSTKGKFMFEKKPYGENPETTGNFFLLSDFNGDGKPDIFHNYNYYGHNTYIRYNQSSPGNPAFGARQIVEGVSEYTRELRAGDMNGDGRPDIVFTLFNALNNTVNILYNKNNNGNPDFTTRIALPAGADPASNALADFDGDGMLDIALTNFSAPIGFSVYRNNPNTNAALTAFSPAIAASGYNITIAGVYLNNVTNVSFGGVPAKSFTVISPTKISAVVDAAGASGDVSLTTSGKTLKLTGFTFVPKPVINVEGILPIPRAGSVVLKAVPSSTDYTYLWRFNGKIISDARQPAYTATKGGLYTVEITKQGVFQTSNSLKIEEMFSLPADNFEITNTDLTCRGQNNGLIKVRAAKVNYNYVALITGNGLNKTINFTSGFNETNLAAGTYNICITIPEQPQYKQCFTSVIAQPEDLSVYTAVSNNSQLLLSLGGGSQYYVNLNGIETVTANNQLNLPLKKGLNNLVVSTDKDCQGKVSRLITTQNEDMVFPNPFKSILYVNLGENIIKKGGLKVYNNLGNMVYSTQFNNASGPFPANLSQLMVGPYTLILEADNKQVMFKIIKE